MRGPADVFFGMKGRDGVGGVAGRGNKLWWIVEWTDVFFGMGGAGEMDFGGYLRGPDC